MEMDTKTLDRLDFEFDDPVPISPPITKKKKKLIDLDDLLEDHEKEQKKLIERKSKQIKIRKVSEQEDEADSATEARLSECVDKCQNEEKLPLKEHLELKNSVLLQSFMKHKISSLVELEMEEGESFLEGLLLNGWLWHIVYSSCWVEKSIATWTFNLILYSPKVELMEAAFEFWCAIFSLKNKQADSSSLKIEWLPKFSDLKMALLLYGFLLDSDTKISTNIDLIHPNCDTEGPPQNIGSWIKCATFCCQIRNENLIFSIQEAEELLAIFISFFLDRQLLGLNLVLHEAMLSVVSFFRDDEWSESCKNVAKSLANRLPCDINCLRVVESTAGVEERCKQLRSALAFQFLVTSLDEKVIDAKEILRMLISINVKDKNCDLFKIYIYLSLVENWLLFDGMLKDKAELHELWGVCLRNFSCGITITDLRPYASNVRSKASYLLQSSTSK